MSKLSELLRRSRETADGPFSFPPARERLDRVHPRSLDLLPIERVSLTPASRIALLTNPSSPEADRFRYLRMRFRELKDSANLHTVVITSPLPQDGKSTIALNLATALAEGGKRSVLLVDGDLYCPSLAASLGIAARPGLAECIESGLDPMSAIFRLEPMNWYFLQAGSPKGNPSEILQSNTVSDVVRGIGAQFDWVLIDSPPVLPLTDALSMSKHVDASVLVVARANWTPLDALEEAVARIGPKNVFGIVLNRAEGVDRLYSRYYTSYYHK